MSIIALIAQMIGLAGNAIKLGQNVAGMISDIRRIHSENRVAGDAEWDALEANIAELQAGGLSDVSKDVG